MTTILPLGTTVCQACRTPVAIVRRTVEVPCADTSDARLSVRRAQVHTHAIPDVAWTVVEASGERHLCAVKAS